MRLLITGVAGFIGSNLAIRLINLGHNVIGIDNFSSGFLSNLHPILTSKNFQLINGDITQDISDFQFKKNIDIIVHLASHKIPRYTNGIRTISDNILMTQNIIKICSNLGTKLIFASTSDVYGKNDSLLFSENSNLVLGETSNKRWAYASSKIVSEQLIIACG